MILVASEADSAAVLAFTHASRLIKYYLMATPASNVTMYRNASNARLKTPCRPMK